MFNVEHQRWRTPLLTLTAQHWSKPQQGMLANFGAHLVFTSFFLFISFWR